MTKDEKLRIARQLERLKVDVIEAGFPIASQGDFESVQAIAKSVRGPVICGLSRTALGDVDRCWEAIESAEHPRIHVFIATSETHMKHKLRMTPDQVKAEAARIRTNLELVTFRTDFDFEPGTPATEDVAGVEAFLGRMEMLATLRRYRSARGAAPAEPTEPTEAPPKKRAKPAEPADPAQGELF